jgi:hypothetical protein
MNKWASFLQENSMGTSLSTTVKAVKPLFKLSDRVFMERTKAPSERAKLARSFHKTPLLLQHLEATKFFAKATLPLFPCENLAKITAIIPILPLTFAAILSGLAKLLLQKLLHGILEFLIHHSSLNPPTTMIKPAYHLQVPQRDQHLHLHLPLLAHPFGQIPSL